MELHFLPNPTRHDETDQRHICLVVENLEKDRLKLAEAGGTILPAEPIPQRPRFFCLDPFGNRLEFTTIQGDYQESP